MKERNDPLKKVLKIAAWFLVAVIVLLGAGLYYFDSILKDTVNKYGPEVTRTDVRLENVSTSLVNTSVVLENLDIGSPKGFSEPHVLTLGRIAVDVDRDSLFTDTIIINSIDISDVNVIYELVGKKSNLAVLSENISSYFQKTSPKASPKTAPKASEPAGKGEPGKKVVIRRLSVRNAEVGLAASIASLTDQKLSTTVRLPDLTLTNIGDNGGMTYAEAAAYILNLISMNSVEALSKTALKSVLYISENALKLTKSAANTALGAAAAAFETTTDIAKGTIGTALDITAGTIGVAKDVAEGTVGTALDITGKAAGTVKDAGEAVGNSIRNLFSK